MKPLGDRKQVLVRLPAELIDQIDARQPGDVQSRNTWMVRLLRTGLSVEAPDYVVLDPKPPPVIPAKPRPTAASQRRDPRSTPPRALPKPGTPRPKPRHGITCGCPICKG